MHNKMKAQMQDVSELSKKYQQQKSDFLDSLQPDDFRNGGSFNQAEDIVNQITKGCYEVVLKNEDPEDFIRKAATNLFRENSSALLKINNLAQAYLKMKIASKCL